MQKKFRFPIKFPLDHPLLDSMLHESYLIDKSIYSIVLNGSKVSRIQSTHTNFFQISRLICLLYLLYALLKMPPT